MSKAIGTDMASVVVTVDEDYDLRCKASCGVRTPEHALVTCSPTTLKHSSLSLERTCSSDAHHIDLTCESLSVLQGDPSSLGADTNGVALRVTLRVLT